jgi:sn-glycerol 3-phosphate transport system ATP-binding protein
MVFQNYALYPHMSVFDNMAYGLKNRGMSKAEIAERIAEASRLLSIDPYLKRRPRELSGGQRQRVAMGRAIVRNPQVFLFDEPLSNLDAKLRVQTRMEIRRLHDRLRATSIFVTHDQVEAMTLADIVVVMSEGAIEQVGAPTEVYRRPATRFVATFIGSPPMNLLPGRIADGGIVELDGGARLRFDTSRFDATPGSAVEAGIRPEDLSLAADGAAADLTITREFVEELGATRVMHGRVNGSALAMVQPASAPLFEHTAFGVSAPVDAVHLFDAGTGRSLRRAA